MRRIVSIALSSLFISNIWAQEQVNKGLFVETGNQYYQDIMNSLNGTNDPMKTTKRFVVDPSTIENLPKSETEFKSAWHSSLLPQGNTGTCWCWSSSSLIDSEVKRQTGKDVKTSVMYLVYQEYIAKSIQYVKTGGKSNFAEGSQTNGAMRMAEMYGIVPMEAYVGKPKEQLHYDHSKMAEQMLSVLDSLVKKDVKDEVITRSLVSKILNMHLGTPPEKFSYLGKEYTPITFMKEYMQFKPSEMIDILSLKQEPFWTKTIYDVPDNWWKDSSYYNIPLDNFIAVIKDAVKAGFTLTISGDVSEAGLLSYEDAAIIPSFDIPSAYINDDARQFRFSNQTTTDDHAMHLVGYKETEGGWWFLVKDSGSGGHCGKNKGYMYYHEDYIKLKITAVTMHKDAAKQILSKF